MKIQECPRLGVALIPLVLASCQTTAGACDVNYVGPPPAHYITAGRALDLMIVTLPSDMVLEQCGGQTPVGCINGNSNFGWRFVIVTDEPERWNLTHQWIVDHETAHWGGWNRCHNN